MSGESVGNSVGVSEKAEWPTHCKLPFTGGPGLGHQCDCYSENQ